MRKVNGSANVWFDESEPRMESHSYQNLLAMLIATSVCVSCGHQKPLVVQNAKPTEMYRLPAKENGNDAGSTYAITYDARGRGAYLVSQSSPLKLCAEPSPDAVANNSASQTTKSNVELAALINAVNATAKGGTEQTQNATSTVAEVATRTELVLVVREALYRICEMNANGVMDNDEAKAVFGEVLHTVRILGQRNSIAQLVEVLKSQNPQNDAALRMKIVEAILSLAAAEAFQTVGIDPARIAAFNLFKLNDVAGRGSSAGDTNTGGTPAPGSKQPKKPE